MQFMIKKNLKHNLAKNFLKKLKKQKINGANVTVPFKKKLFPFWTN